MSYTKLTNIITKQFREGVALSGISRTVTFEDGTAFEVPLPFLPIGDDLVLTPKVIVDGDKALRIDLTRWCPSIVSQWVTATLPVDCDQALAVRMARAYHADPATSWTDPVANVSAWVGTWAAANGVATTGPDDAESSS